MNDKELRELDAWIAEHVMGWLFNRHGIPFSPHPDDKWQAETVVPHYTTEPDAALAVLAKCCEEAMMEDCVYVGKTEQEWIVGHTTRNFEEVADTLPLAICKFAQTLFKK